MTDAGSFSTWLVEDHLVVLDRGRSELRVLNPSAAALWLWLEEEPRETQGLATLLTSLRGRPDNLDIREQVADTLAEWSQLGWLDHTSSGHALRTTHPGSPDPYGGRAVRLDPATSLPAHQEIVRLHLTLGGKSCLVVFASTGALGFPDAIPRLSTVLGGLARICEADDDAKGPEIRLVHAGDRFWVVQPGQLLLSGDESFALSSVAMAVLKLAYAQDGLFATVHAAAVANSGGALLLPGASGRGKSTLTAYLAAQGWSYLGDDVVALGQWEEENVPVILPFPTAVGLKPPSWSIMAEAYPQISQLPVIPYADREARFVRLPRTDGLGRDRRRIRAVVLPSYENGQAAALEPVAPVDALCALIESGVTTGDLLEPERVEKVLGMVERLPFYRMIYSSLSDAENLLAELAQ